MKKYLMTIAASLCCMTMLFTMTSCTNDLSDNPVIIPEPQPVPEPEQLADVAVLFYGHGGGNLDASLIGNIRQFYRAEPSCYNNVKVAVEYKFSGKEEIPHYDIEEWEKEFIFDDMEDDIDDPSITNDEYIRWMDPEGLLNHNYQVDYSVLLATKGAYQCALWERTDKVNDTQTAYIYRLDAVRYYNPDGTFTTYNVIGEYEGQGDEPDYTLEYLNDSTWGGTLESTYGQTAFDRAVGWSRWLMLNEQEPPLWSRHDFNTSLPDGDLMDDPSL